MDAQQLLESMQAQGVDTSGTHRQREARFLNYLSRQPRAAELSDKKEHKNVLQPRSEPRSAAVSRIDATVSQLDGRARPQNTSSLGNLTASANFVPFQSESHRFASELQQQMEGNKSDVKHSSTARVISSLPSFDSFPSSDRPGLLSELAGISSFNGHADALTRSRDGNAA
jgi:hypothetical protein